MARDAYPNFILDASRTTNGYFIGGTYYCR